MGNGKVFYKGSHHDFIVLTENESSYQQYLAEQSNPKTPKTTPLSDVIAGNMKVYTTENGRGSEGVLFEASKMVLENEFGKGKHVEEIVGTILKDGQVKSGLRADRKSWSSTNDSYRDF